MKKRMSMKLKDVEKTIINAVVNYLFNNQGDMVIGHQHNKYNEEKVL
jgi:hypothetical protein